MSRRDADRMSRREKWMVQRIADAFGLGENRVLRTMREEENVELLLRFIGRDGPQRLFVYYQPRAVQSNDREGGGDDSGSKSESDTNDFENEPVLFLTLGNAEPLVSKACYFLRMSVNTNIDMEVSADESVLFGELGTGMPTLEASGGEKTSTTSSSQVANANGLVLNDVHALVEVLFAKGIEGLAQDAWGGAATDQRSEILDDLNHFEIEMYETLKSRSKIIDLSPPSEEYLDSPKVHAAKLAKEKAASGSLRSRMPESSYNKSNTYESKRVAHYEVSHQKRSPT